MVQPPSVGRSGGRTLFTGAPGNNADLCKPPGFPTRGSRGSVINKHAAGEPVGWRDRAPTSYLCWEDPLPILGLRCTPFLFVCFLNLNSCAFCLLKLAEWASCSVCFEIMFLLSAVLLEGPCQSPNSSHGNSRFSLRHDISKKTGCVLRVRSNGIQFLQGSR